MRVAVLAHLRYPIAPPFKGGMEAHCHGLVTALAARGHDVTLFASGDSDASLPLAPVTPVHYDAVLPWERWNGTPELARFQQDAFARAWSMIAEDGFDIVHNNSMNTTVHDWALRDRRPMVTSLHVPPFAGLADTVARTAAPWLRQTTTSLAHQRTWWAVPPKTASMVHNGIETTRWPYCDTGNGRAIWCGRITPNKGTAVAIVAAQRAGIPLDLVGPIDCRDFYETQVAPLLGEGSTYLGQRSGPALAALVGAASVMLVTPMWDEPFGLVAAEAMTCGVPVAALDRGALREVVGEAGALAAGPDELPEAIRRALTLPRAACRARVERLFSIARMIDGYKRAYAAAIDGARASSNASTRALLA